MIRTVETAGGLRLLGLIGNSFSWEARFFIALASLVLLNFKWQDLCQEVQLISRSEAVTSLSTIDRHAAASCYLQFYMQFLLLFLSANKTPKFININKVILVEISRNC